MNESAYIDRWIRSRLMGDNGLGGLLDPTGVVGQGARVGGVYSEVVPQGAALPSIRFSLIAPTDTNSVQGYRIITGGLWLVAAVIRAADYGLLAAAADRIDEVLHRAAGTLSPVTVLSCVRESSYRLAEDEGDVHYRHLGGLYRIQAQEE